MCQHSLTDFGAVGKKLEDLRLQLKAGKDLSEDDPAILLNIIAARLIPVAKEQGAVISGSCCLPDEMKVHEQDTANALHFIWEMSQKELNAFDFGGPWHALYCLIGNAVERWFGELPKADDYDGEGIKYDALTGISVP